MAGAGGKVAVGVSTIAGYSVSAAAFAAAVAALVAGDRSEQTIGTIGAGVVGLGAFLVTQAGRYMQAHAQAKGTVVVPVAGHRHALAADHSDPGAALATAVLLRVAGELSAEEPAA